MLAIATVYNTESTVYTVPEGKTAMVEIFFNPSYACFIEVKVNNVSVFDEIVEEAFSIKIVLNAGDNVQVNTDGVVNVVISGMEV